MRHPKNKLERKNVKRLYRNKAIDIARNDGWNGWVRWKYPHHSDSFRSASWEERKRLLYLMTHNEVDEVPFWFDETRKSSATPFFKRVACKATRRKRYEKPKNAGYKRDYDLKWNLW